MDSSRKKTEAKPTDERSQQSKINIHTKIPVILELHASSSTTLLQGQLAVPRSTRVDSYDCSKTMYKGNFNRQLREWNWISPFEFVEFVSEMVREWTWIVGTLGDRQSRSKPSCRAAGLPA